MKNRLIRSGLALLLGVALLTGTLGTDTASAATRTKAWYEDLTVEIPSVTVTNNDGYLVVDDGTSVPTVSSGLRSGQKGASSLPSAYMNTLAELTEKYPSVRDQGDYNTCWAFSAIGLAEFDLITDDKIADKSIDLSEYQVSYFTYHNQTDVFGGTFGDLFNVPGDYLMAGGNLYTTARALLQWQGVANESLMPYSQISSSQTFGSSYAFNQNVAHLQNAYIINIHTNQDAVKREIQTHGSAGIGFYMSLYAGFDTTATYDKTGETVATYYCPYSGTYSRVDFTANHAVNVVGWDDDFPASAFSYTPAGNGAWLIRNSWSDASGNDINSYFWLSYYDKTIEDEAWIYDFESADNYDYNYQYDGCDEVYGLNTLMPNSNVTKYANVFQVQGSSNELLKAVSISLTDSSEVSYTIKVYANLPDASKPKSGILAATVTGKTSYAGTYTIPLGKAVSLPKGSYYSVVVELGSAKGGLDTEITYQFSTGETSTAYIKKNQSFVYYNGAWRDMSSLSGYGIGNLCIKAYTSKTGASIAQTKSLKKSSVKKNSVKISWAKTSGATGYEIYRSTSKTGVYTKVATVKKTSYTNTKLKANKTYYYKVRAYKKSGSTTVYGKLSGAFKVKTKKK